VKIKVYFEPSEDEGYTAKRSTAEASSTFARYGSGFFVKINRGHCEPVNSIKGLSSPIVIPPIIAHAAVYIYFITSKTSNLAFISSSQFVEKSLQMTNSSRFGFSFIENNRLRVFRNHIFIDYTFFNAF